MVWNVQKSGLEKCPDGCVDFKKFKPLYLRNYSADRIEFQYGGKAQVSFYLV